MIINSSEYCLVKKNFLKMEYQNVNENIRELKRCQLTFLTISITATAVIFSLLGKIPEGSSPSIAFLALLAPIFLLIPSGMIFFDKSVTISRAVGYLRIVERLMLDNIKVKNFWGFEVSLGIWRNYPFAQKEAEIFARVKENHQRIQNDFNVQLEKIPKINSIIQNSSLFSALKEIYSLLILINPLRYWMLVYYFYVVLSYACIFMSMALFYKIKNSTPALPQGYLFGIGSIIVGLSMIVTAFAFFLVYFTYHLTYGHWSYDFNEQIWKEILIGPEAKFNSIFNRWTSNLFIQDWNKYIFSSE